MAGLAGLSGCAQPLRDPSELPLVYSGRLAIRAPSTAFSARFELSGHPTQGRLQLLSPLGTTVADAVWSPTSVVIRTGDQMQVFETLDDAAHRLLGQPIPLIALWDWLQGQPWPTAPSLLTSDPKGFEQLGWRVDTSQLADQGLLHATHAGPTDALTLRIRLDR